MLCDYSILILLKLLYCITMYIMCKCLVKPHVLIHPAKEKYVDFSYSSFPIWTSIEFALVWKVGSTEYNSCLT